MPAPSATRGARVIPAYRGAEEKAVVGIYVMHTQSRAELASQEQKTTLDPLQPPAMTLETDDTASMAGIVALNFALFTRELSRWKARATPSDFVSLCSTIITNPLDILHSRAMNLEFQSRESLCSCKLHVYLLIRDPVSKIA